MKMMKAKVIDSTHLELLKPISSKNGKTVVVIVTDADEKDDERQEWLSLSMEGLRAAYGDSEPVYELSMIKEKNPEYGV